MLKKQCIEKIPIKLGFKKPLSKEGKYFTFFWSKTGQSYASYDRKIIQNNSISKDSTD